VIRDIERKCQEPDSLLATMLERAKRIFTQKRDDKNKLYSMQAPEVECISKGKVAKKYEFGCKVSLVSTSKDNWIVGIQALHGNPYDGHTLKDALAQAEQLTGWRPENAYCDKGYKGEPKEIDKTAIHLANRKKKSMKAREWAWFKRRSAIEPIIGHTKSDHRMNRNYLKGEEGDKINAILAGCGFNLRKLLRAILLWLFKERFRTSINDLMILARRLNQQHQPA
jgi:transposase, IS5 family